MADSAAVPNVERVSHNYTSATHQKFINSVDRRLPPTQVLPEQSAVATDGLSRTTSEPRRGAICPGDREHSLDITDLQGIQREGPTSL